MQSVRSGPLSLPARGFISSSPSQSSSLVIYLKSQSSYLRSVCVEKLNYLFFFFDRFRPAFRRQRTGLYLFQRNWRNRQVDGRRWMFPPSRFDDRLLQNEGIDQSKHWFDSLHLFQGNSEICWQIIFKNYWTIYFGFRAWKRRVKVISPSAATSKFVTLDAGSAAATV